MFLPSETLLQPPGPGLKPQSLKFAAGKAPPGMVARMRLFFLERAPLDAAGPTCTRSGRSLKMPELKMARAAQQQQSLASGAAFGEYLTKQRDVSGRASAWPFRLSQRAPRATVSMR
jgi:hypothetical protein